MLCSEGAGTLRWALARQRRFPRRELVTTCEAGAGRRARTPEPKSRGVTLPLPPQAGLSWGTWGGVHGDLQPGSNRWSDQTRGPPSPSSGDQGPPSYPFRFLPEITGDSEE